MFLYSFILPFLTTKDSLRSKILFTKIFHTSDRQQQQSPPNKQFVKTDHTKCLSEDQTSMVLKSLLIKDKYSSNLHYCEIITTINTIKTTL